MMLSYFLFSPEKLASEDTAARLASADFIYLSCIPFLSDCRDGRDACKEALESFRRTCAKAENRNAREGMGRARNAGSGSPKVLLSTPFISKGRLFATFCRLFPTFAPLFDGFLLQNVGDAALIGDLTASAFGAAFKKPSGGKFFLAGDTSFNITNRESAEYWSGRLDLLAVLPELSADAQSCLAREFPASIIPEITAFSAAVIARSEHCAAAGNTFRCGRCGPSGLSAGHLLDERGRSFTIISNPYDCSSLLLGVPREETFIRNAFLPGIDLSAKTKACGSAAQKAVFRVYEGL